MTSRWIIPTLLILAGIVRLWAVSLSNLPVGDEINGYIFNAQRFARNLWVPSLENFPLVSITYGVIIIALNAFLNTLAGVLASWILTVLSGVVTVYFLFKSAKYLNGGHAATVIAISLMVFPGVFFVFRGDLSLYFICLSALQFSLIRLLQRPSIIWGIVPGIIATIFYLSRSDGMFILILSLVVFTIAKRGLLRFVPVVLVIFACGVVVFLLIRYTTMGEFGKGPGTRALHAFYQAEGMHDGKGGSWHDYTARGIAKFGPPEKYRNSVMRLMLSHPGDVFQRAYNNLKVIKNYIGEATGLPLWVFGLLVIISLLGKYRRLIAFLALPPLCACFIYLAFYFQRSYFVMLSYGLAILLACSLLSLMDLISLHIPRRTPQKAIRVILPIAVCIWLFPRALDVFPGTHRETTTVRFWDALVFAKGECELNDSCALFARQHVESQSIHFYIDKKPPALGDNELEGLSKGEIGKLMEERGIHYIFALKEDNQLWSLYPDIADCVFKNKNDDVRVLKLRH